MLFIFSLVYVFHFYFFSFLASLSVTIPTHDRGQNRIYSRATLYNTLKKLDIFWTLDAFIVMGYPPMFGLLHFVLTFVLKNLKERNLLNELLLNFKTFS